MGAETYRHRLKFRRNIYVVKLNNPLMGTEMLKRGEKYERDLHTGVKLNNPLVGTEIKGGESIMGGTFGRPR